MVNVPFVLAHRVWIKYWFFDASVCVLCLLCSALGIPLSFYGRKNNVTFFMAISQPIAVALMEHIQIKLLLCAFNWAELAHSLHIHNYIHVKPILRTFAEPRRCPSLRFGSRLAARLRLEISKRYSMRYLCTFSLFHGSAIRILT